VPVEVASLLPPEDASPATDTADRRSGSRAGLVVGLALALLAVMVVAVVAVARRDVGDPRAALTTTPTARATVTPTVEATPTSTIEPQPTLAATAALPASGLGPFTGGQAPADPGSWIADVRTAGHDGYDRVVFEFTGIVPTYDVRYVVPPFVDTAGTEKAVDGTAFVDVWLRGTSTVQLDGARLIEHYRGPDRVGAGDTAVVTEVVDIDDFESNVHWTIGLTGERPVAVTTLDDPGRLVIDISH
jgi:hypothetical protein